MLIWKSKYPKKITNSSYSSFQVNDALEIWDLKSESSKATSRGGGTRSITHKKEEQKVNTGQKTSVTSENLPTSAQPLDWREIFTTKNTMRYRVLYFFYIF